MELWTVKVLLRVPELIDAVQPLVGKPVDAQVIFELIGLGDIQPLGYVHRMPIFAIEQIGDVIAALRQTGLPIDSPPIIA